MILLRNYSTIGTYIQIDSTGYKVVKEKCPIRQGIGGFSENGELIGLYIDKDKLFFQYNDKTYQTKPDEIICTNERLKGDNRRFKVKIKDILVCDIVYKPYVKPLALIFGDDEDEFDFLLHLSKLMKSEESILNFIKGMKNLNDYYSNNS